MTKLTNHDVYPLLNHMLAEQIEATHMLNTRALITFIAGMALLLIQPNVIALIALGVSLINLVIHLLKNTNKASTLYELHTTEADMPELTWDLLNQATVYCTTINERLLTIKSRLLLFTYFLLFVAVVF